MTLQSSRLLWFAGGLIAVTIGYFASRTPEPARTALELVAILCEGSLEGGRAEWLERRLGNGVEFDTTDPDLPSGTRSLSFADIERELRQLRARSPHCSTSLGEWHVRSAAGRTWVEGMLRYSASQFGDLHEQRRPLRLAFDARGDEPVLQRIVLGPAERREPEARP